MTHGKRSTYVRGCRCEPCSEATRKWRKAYSIRAHRAGGAVRMDSAPVKAHLETLTPFMSLSAIEAAAHVGRSTVVRVINGTTTTIHPRVAKALLAVRADAKPEGHWYNATGAARRLQALQAIGWSMPKIAAEMGGYGRQNINLVLLGIRTNIGPGIERRVKDAYDVLWDQEPPADNHYARAAITKAKNRAQRLGWAPPMAWDDDTIDDPAATPDVGAPVKRPSGGQGRPIAELVEDITWLLRHDSAMTAGQLAERLGYGDRSSIQIALARHGHHDILERLNRNAKAA